MIRLATPSSSIRVAKSSQLARRSHHDGSPAELIAPAAKHRACDEMAPGDVRFRATDKPANKSAIRFEDVP